MNAKLSYRLAAVASFLLLAALTTPARAGDGRWTPMGPGGGIVYSLALDPQNPSILYAVTQGGVYRSVNAGTSWAWVTDVGGCCTGAVVVDPARPEVVYAGGTGALNRSEDHGRTWTTVLSARRNELLPDRLLAVVPGSPSTVFISDSARLLRSRDEGRTWERMAFDRDAFQMVVHPRNPAVLYLISFSGLFKSRDGGQTWEPLDFPRIPYSDEDPYALALAPSAPGTVYLATSGRFFRSRDGGGRWTAFPGLGFVHKLAVDPVDSDTVWAAASLGMWVSRDAGETWNPANRGLPFDRLGHLDLDVRAVVIDPSNPDVLYAGFSLLRERSRVDGGVAKSTNGGRSWGVGWQKGFSASQFGFVRFDPWTPGSIYTAIGPISYPTNFRRIVRSLDRGRQWEPFAEKLGKMGDLTFDPAVPGVVIVAGDEGVWRSEDFGASWRRIDAEPASHLAVSAQSTILAAGACGLRRSTDRGRTWQQVLSCETSPTEGEYPVGIVIRDFTVDPSNPRRVYARAFLENALGAVYERLLRSGDAGATWQRIGLGCDPLAIAPSDPRVLYLGRLNPVNGYELLRSSDRGGTWIRVATPDRIFEALAVAPWDPDTLYGAVQGRGVLRSTDGGATWEPLHNGLAGIGRLDVRNVALDPWYPGRLFTWGADKGGLFELRDPEAPGRD